LWSRARQTDPPVRPRGEPKCRRATLLLLPPAPPQVPKHAIITSLARQPTPDLAVFATVLRGQPDGARVPLQYRTFGERHRLQTAVLCVDRKWCARSTWRARRLQEFGSAAPLAGQPASNRAETDKGKGSLCDVACLAGPEKGGWQGGSEGG
jgi:hypothetical protein